MINCISDAEDIAKRIKILIEDYDNQSKSARDFALEHSWPKVCKRILDIFEKRKAEDYNNSRCSGLFDQIMAHAKYLDEKEYEEKLQKLGRPHHLLPEALGKSWLTFHLDVLRKELSI